MSLSKETKFTHPSHTWAICDRLSNADSLGQAVTFTQIMNIFDRIDGSKDEHFEKFDNGDKEKGVDGDGRMVFTKHSGIKNLDRFYDDHPDFWRNLKKKPIPDVLRS
jgi:uncharacterized protein YhfF